MTIAKDLFCCMVEFMIPSVAELSIWTEVRGCGCPISLSVIRSGTVGLYLIKVDLHSSSEAAGITFLMIS